MCNEFSQIFQLCQFVMENSQNAPLVHATLETLLRFLNWIPLGYIFETKLISTLIYKFLNVPMFRNVSLKCLTEIAGVSVSQYEEQFVTLFTLTMMQLKQMLPLNTNIRLAYSNGKDDEQNFIQNLSLFLCTFLKEHGQLIEKRLNLRETLMEALHYMLLVSEVEETEIFKICLEYWNHLAAELYRESPFSTSASPLLSGSQHFDVPPRRQLYLPVLSKIPSDSMDLGSPPLILFRWQQMDTHKWINREEGRCSVFSEFSRARAKLRKWTLIQSM
ncbi:exportin-1-like isoform X2 [Lagopus muta]|nr:exportin-1-like isoform X2 [Lagopus muta]XP_048792593.1 exportin-1-like isoform X2 [Lagopus muta]XP_048792594.1 exportin-1-like isoform X2 [Lagopus muta]XP_048792595.1 exportin-1-like isoform X2 [Lagopus muta]XP_048792596.1 exportin-1-like isoform X2 [Lagopus muta]